MYVSSTTRIKTPQARQGFQQSSLRVSTPLENRRALQQLDLEHQMEVELNSQTPDRRDSAPLRAFF